MPVTHGQHGHAPMTLAQRPAPSRSLLHVTAALIGGLLVAACGGGERKADSQVAAIVNKGEISVHQVQAVLQRQPRLQAGDAGGSASARVLEGLIDQELAAQAAQAQSLDRDPRVVQAVEAARRELLAHAYQESIAAKVGNPGSDEVERYYESHPALFARRRLYILQETLLEGTPEQFAGLPDKVAQAQGADELKLLLDRAGVRSEVRVRAQASEDLPQLLLEPLARLDAGRSAYFAQAQGARVYTVLQAHEAPVDLHLATNAITAYIANDRKAQAIAQAMKELRAAAQVAYQGPFAKPRATAASAPDAR